MRVDQEPKRYPWWQLILIGFVGLLESIVRPLRRMWGSDDPLDRYGLVHFVSSAGDALVAIALADSVFFSLPVGQAKIKVAAYLAATMAPLAIAGPLLVPLLDRAGPRRAISLSSVAGRAVIALYAAPRFDSDLLFLLAFLLLALSKVHTITKNGLTMAYAGPNEGLVRANARLGRLAVGGVAMATPFGVLFLKALGGAQSVFVLAAVVYAFGALLNARLPHPRVPKAKRARVGARGRIPELMAPAIGAVGLRAASGFLLFLLAFALRREGYPLYWFGVLAGAGTAGMLLADLVSPRLPNNVREEVVVILCVVAGALGAFLAFEAFVLAVLAVFGLIVGMSAEFGRLAFQSLMQRLAPSGALGRVFVRYEVMFQLAWVGGALLSSMFRIEFRGGILVLAAFYVVVALGFLFGPRIERTIQERAEAERRPSEG